MTGVVLGPKEVADAIRPHIELGHVAPEDQHALNFLKQVASHLGLDHTPDVIQHIASVMREKGLKLHTGQEYPKHVQRKVDGKWFDAKDKADENRIINEVPDAPPPEPDRLPNGMLPDIRNQVPITGQGENAAVRDRLAHDPVDDQGRPTDNRDRVPHTELHEAKSELDKHTDREAAQGQRPLQSGHDRLGGHQVVDQSSGLHQDHFAEQEPGAAAMRQSFVDDGVTVVDDGKPTHDQPAARPDPTGGKRP